MSYPKYELVGNPELKVGDVIIEHGGLFRVIEVQDISHGYADNGCGPTHANYCEFIRDVSDAYPCVVPKRWRVRWNRQGNNLSRVARVISEVAA